MELISLQSAMDMEGLARSIPEERSDNAQKQAVLSGTICMARIYRAKAPPHKHIRSNKKGVLGVFGGSRTKK
jgi:hypothetical protein